MFDQLLFYKGQRTFLDFYLEEPSEGKGTRLQIIFYTQPSRGWVFYCEYNEK